MLEFQGFRCGFTNIVVIAFLFRTSDSLTIRGNGQSYIHYPSHERSTIYDERKTRSIDEMIPYSYRSGSGNINDVSSNDLHKTSRQSSHKIVQMLQDLQHYSDAKLLSQAQGIHSRNSDSSNTNDYHGSNFLSPLLVEQLLRTPDFATYQGRSKSKGKSPERRKQKGSTTSISESYVPPPKEPSPSYSPSGNGDQTKSKNYWSMTFGAIPEELTNINDPFKDIFMESPSNSYNNGENNKYQESSTSVYEKPAKTVTTNYNKNEYQKKLQNSKQTEYLSTNDIIQSYPIHKVDPFESLLLTKKTFDQPTKGQSETSNSKYPTVSAVNSYSNQPYIPGQKSDTTYSKYSSVSTDVDSYSNPIYYPDEDENGDYQDTRKAYPYTAQPQKEIYTDENDKLDNPFDYVYSENPYNNKNVQSEINVPYSEDEVPLDDINDDNTQDGYGDPYNYDSQPAPYKEVVEEDNGYSEDFYDENSYSPTDESDVPISPQEYAPVEETYNNNYDPYNTGTRDNDMNTVDEDSYTSNGKTNSPYEDYNNPDDQDDEYPYANENAYVDESYVKEDVPSTGYESQYTNSGYEDTKVIPEEPILPYLKPSAPVSSTTKLPYVEELDKSSTQYHSSSSSSQYTKNSQKEKIPSSKNQEYEVSEKRNKDSSNGGTVFTGSLSDYPTQTLVSNTKSNSNYLSKSTPKTTSSDPDSTQYGPSSSSSSKQTSIPPSFISFGSMPNRRGNHNEGFNGGRKSDNLRPRALEETVDNFPEYNYHNPDIIYPLAYVLSNSNGNIYGTPPSSPTRSQFSPPSSSPILPAYQFNQNPPISPFQTQFSKQYYFPYQGIIAPDMSRQEHPMFLQMGSPLLGRTTRSSFGTKKY